MGLPVIGEACRSVVIRIFGKMVNRSTITGRQTLLLLLFFSACFLLCLPFYRSKVVLVDG